MLASGASPDVSHPMRHVLTNVVGLRELADIHVAEQDLLDGDVLLLCSDGVHDVLDDSTLAALMAQHMDLRACAEAILAAALEHGSRDNVTVVLVRYESDGRHE
jgi:protein phosphatase